MQLSQPKQSPVKTRFGERFIPNRGTSNLLTFEKLQDHKSIFQSSEPEEQSNIYSALLKGEIFSQRPEKLLHYSNSLQGKENDPAPDIVSSSMYSPLKSHRKIPKAPYKVLDAPALQDDFYLSLVDWSSENILSVGLGPAIYMWNASNSKVNKLCELGNGKTVTSLAWSSSGQHIALGSNDGSLLLWDASHGKQLRSFAGHTARVGSMAWNGGLLSTGSRDRSILHRDPRAPEDFVSRLAGHKQEVCGLKWSFDGQQLSSGGNDNKLMIWNLHSAVPVLKFSQHVAAIKALAWSRCQNGLLVSGGGTADRTMRFWNTLTGEQLQCIDTGSQVCNLMFSCNSREIVSTHGYSLNQIVIWRYPDICKVATLTGHTCRVLYLAMSPDGQTIVTGAGDETLRFWEVFPSAKDEEHFNSNPMVLPNMFNIR